MTGFAKRTDIPELKALWKSCFGDPQAYIDFYFENGFPLFDTMIRSEEGKIVSMLTLIPAVYRFEGKDYPASYIYAVATDPASRGKGYAAELMQDAHGYLKGKGIAAAVLFPASDSLYRYYERLGYRTAFAVKNAKLNGSGSRNEQSAVRIAACTSDEFVLMRNRFLHRIEPVCYLAKPADGYLYSECIAAGGEVIKLKCEALQGYAVCYKIEHNLLIKETDLTRDQLELFAKPLSRRFDADKIIAKFPAANGTIIRHGMGLALDERLAADIGYKPGYMNLILD